MVKLNAVTYTGLPRANVEYEVQMLKGKIFIILYDLDLQDSRSLANDVEAVMQDLKKVINGVENAVIIYRDSEGCFDQIKYNSSRKIKLVCLDALSIEEALQTWDKMQNIS